MPIKYVIDAHALLWFLGEDPRLGSTARSVLKEPNISLIIPAIVLAEACWVIGKGRALVTVENTLAVIDNDPCIEVYPLTRTVVERSISLSAIAEMHDRQIVATALVLQDEEHNVNLITKDENISASGLVTTIW